MIALNQLSMAYGQHLLFMNVSLRFESPHRYAIVGANGVGKSTLFKLLQHEEEPTDGEVHYPKDASIGWLKQDQFNHEQTLIREIVLQGRPKLCAALKERDEILASDQWTDESGYRLGTLEEIIMHEEGYTAEADAERLLAGLGIRANYFNQPLSSLSGGYKVRVLLARTLFQRPEILLLDEPTNHLDIVSIAWFESFLKHEFKGLVLFISHDVAFINRVADYVADIDFGEIRIYRGDYQHFLSEKALIQEQKRLERQGLENRINDMQRFVDRFKAKASKAAQARSRMKMIEKIVLPDLQQSSRIAPALQFTQKRPSGKKVIDIQLLNKSYGQQTLFHHLNLAIHRSEKVAILGGNGLGKSTLMKMMLGLILPDAGAITLGHEVHYSYFSQDHHDLLNQSVSAYDWLRDAASDATDQQVRNTLAQVLFTKDEVHKNVLTLSGGEAARLLLAKVMLDAPNLIFLDEPTNHLDLESIEALANALKMYHGTVIFITHNRYLIHAVATRVLYLAGHANVKDEKVMTDGWKRLDCF